MESDLINELFKQYYNEALLYVMTLCKNRTMAEDAVSHAFFKALQMADEEIRDFKPWLMAVCRNEIFAQMRKRKYLSDEELQDDISGGEEILERLIRQEQYISLYRAISRLKTEQREVIELFYFSGLSVKETADVVGKSKENVKVLLHRARVELKKFLEVEA